MAKIGFIVNPVSGRGRGQLLWQRISGAAGRLGDTVDVRVTTGPAQAEALALELCRNGANLVVALGGDGTIS